MASRPPEPVRVWTCRTDGPVPREACRALLAPQEVARAERRRRPADRAEALAAAAFRRAALARETGRRPEALAFVTECRRCGHPDHGKPALAGPDGDGLTFSQARTAGLAIVAVCRAEVGADVEREAGWDVRPAARLALSEAERAPLEGLSPERAAAWFLRLWTLKEAYLKGVGLGLAADPSHVTFTGAGGAWRRVLHDGAETGWHARAVELGGPWRAAVAVEGPPRPVRVAAAASPLLADVTAPVPHRPGDAG